MSTILESFPVLLAHKAGAIEVIALLAHCVFEAHGFEQHSHDDSPLRHRIFRSKKIDSEIKFYALAFSSDLLILHAKSNIEPHKIHKLNIKVSSFVLPPQARLPANVLLQPIGAHLVRLDKLVLRVETQLLFRVAPALRPTAHVGTDPGELPPPLLRLIFSFLDADTLRHTARTGCRALVPACREAYFRLPLHRRRARQANLQSAEHVFSYVPFLPWAHGPGSPYGPPFPWAHGPGIPSYGPGVIDPLMPQVPDGLVGARPRALPGPAFGRLPYL